MKTDAQYMQMALDYAHQHAIGNQGHVGAVLMRDNVIIARGASDDERGMHAEQAVLSNTDAVGSIAYVTIQPSLYRTDESMLSDSELLIDAGVTRVVVGSLNTKYRLQESQKFFKRHGVSFSVIGGSDRSEKCLDLFVSTGADQIPIRRTNLSRLCRLLTYAPVLTTQRNSIKTRPTLP